MIKYLMLVMFVLISNNKYVNQGEFVQSSFALILKGFYLDNLATPVKIMLWSNLCSDHTLITHNLEISAYASHSMIPFSYEISTMLWSFTKSRIFSNGASYEVMINSDESIVKELPTIQIDSYTLIH